jgi:hypothetical protein
MDTPYQEILAHVESLQIVDTHEHLPGTEDQRERDTDVLREYLTHYFSRDLVSAGLPRGDLQRARDHRLPLMDRWRVVEPYWEMARNTGYARALDISARDLYGVDGLRGSTLEELNGRFLATLAGGQYQRVLKEKSRIQFSVLDADLACDQRFFRSVFSIDHFVCPRSADDVRLLAADVGMSVTCFDDWLEVTLAGLSRAFARGAVGLKSSLANIRSLRYERFTRAAAEEAFNALFAVAHYPDWEAQALHLGKPFQDYLMHWVLREANRRGWTFQVHTGLLEGNGNLISNSDPLLLSNLFLEYPDVKFDLFHIGYPWQQQVSAPAKSFPNVFIDMCWAHIISPAACIHALEEWLDAVPSNKISAFGGDYLFVDGVYGHQVLARRNVSAALALKVERGALDVAHAIAIANRLFVETPQRLFRTAPVA